MSAGIPLVGLVVPFGERARDRPHLRFEESHFRRFLATGLGADLKVDHRDVLTTRGARPAIGKVRRFASIRSPVRGLLCLGLVDADLAELARSLEVTEWSMSAGLTEYEDGSRGIGEVSLTRDPALRSAALLAVGEQATRTWDLLTSVAVAV